MKKKKPDSLIICGKKRKVTYDPTKGGGACELATGNITIGTDRTDWKEILLHEVAEFILFTQGHRYCRYDDGNDGLRFSFDHLGFENYIQELSCVIEQIYAYKKQN